MILGMKIMAILAYTVRMEQESLSMLFG